MADAFTMGSPRTTNSDLWWYIAAGGIGLVLVATIISFFNNFERVDSEDKASAVFSLLGYLAFVGALAFMAAMQKAWPMAIRVAVLLGAGFFALHGMTGLMVGMAAGMMGMM